MAWRFGMVFGSSLLILTACGPTHVAVNVGNTSTEPAAGTGQSTRSTEPGDPEERLARLAGLPLAPGQTADLPNKNVIMPRAGSTNAYGVAVTPALQAAYDAYLAGNGMAALVALDQEQGAGPVHNWHISALRAQVLIMMGRSGDAQDELDRTTRLERATFGQDIFARALQGEVHVWTGDYARAVEVLLPVAEAVKGWRLPTTYGSPPSNIAELVYVTTAQLRAYTALAGQYLLREEVDKALSWARRAETLFADVHYVADHILYGQYLAVHADSFYGRALNLSFLGAAEIVTAKDLSAGNDALNRADTFHRALGYQPGQVTTQALRAWSALAIGETDKAEADAAIAVEMALRAGLSDLVWRVQALRGEALIAGGRKAEAEEVLRSAEAAVASVSGALSSDRAKRRFGVGKSDITYRLAQFDIAKGDLEGLFIDLERGRARAFVDMLAMASVSGTDGAEFVDQIRALDDEIRRKRLVAASTNGAADGIAAMLERRESLLRDLAKAAPDLAEVYGVQTVTLRQVRAALPRRTVMLYGVPAIAEDPVRVLAITHDGSKLIDTGSRRADLTDALEDLTDGVALKDPGLQTEAAKDLRDGLAVDQWPRADQYLIVPSGELFFVPWGLVIDEASVSVLPAGGWVLRDMEKIGTARSPVVVGDPAFGGTLSQLPGAKAEADAVAALYDTKAITGTAATEATVRGAIHSGTGILHLATHASFEPAYPLRSSIYLSGPNGAVSAVTAEDLYRNPMRADFVVLSACETGFGSAEAGDDFLGLVRSFYLGGSVGVVNSLWPVDDAGTRVFMEALHRNLPSGPGTAWRIAKDETLKAGYPPAVFGAFVLGGAFDR